VSEKLIISGDWWDFKHVAGPLRVEGPDKDMLYLGNTNLRDRTIEISKELYSMDYFSIVLHEGLHAILGSRTSVDPFFRLNEDEHAVEVLAKELAGYLRQLHSRGLLNDVLGTAEKEKGRRRKKQ
jgi:hypothetical protein